MAGSTTNIDTISASQASKEVTANAFFDASSQAALFGRRASTTSALTWGFYGGALKNNGVISQITNSTVALTASTTNYVEATAAGVVSKNTTGFTAGSRPLYTIVTGTATVTSYTDHRNITEPAFGFLSKSVAAGGTINLTQAEAACNTFEFTGTLPNNTTVVFPAAITQVQVDNLTSGAYTLTCKVGSVGVEIPQGKTMTLYCNGTIMEDANTAKSNIDFWCGTAAGTANALTASSVITPIAYSAGQRFYFKSSASPNTGASTLAVNGLAATAIQQNGAALTGGEIAASLWYGALYDGAAFQLFRVGGDLAYPHTIITPGTTGAATIHKPAGRVNAAAAATSLVVTNSLVTANSHIFCNLATNDATAAILSVVPGSGSFTINLTAPTAETAIDFLVVNGV